MKDSSVANFPTTTYDPLLRNANNWCLLRQYTRTYTVYTGAQSDYIGQSSQLVQWDVLGRSQITTLVLEILVSLLLPIRTHHTTSTVNGAMQEKLRHAKVSCNDTLVVCSSTNGGESSHIGLAHGKADRRSVASLQMFINHTHYRYTMEQ